MIQSNASRDEFIREREDALQKEYQQLLVGFDRLSHVRLLLFFAIILLVSVYFFSDRQWWLLIGAGVISCVFCFVVLLHIRNRVSASK